MDMRCDAFLSRSGANAAAIVNAYLQE